MHENHCQLILRNVWNINPFIMMYPHDELCLLKKYFPVLFFFFVSYKLCYFNPIHWGLVFTRNIIILY